MASLQERKRKNGSSWVIQFYINGKRKNVFLSDKYSKVYAKEIAGIVERLAECVEIETEPDRRTKAWLSEIGDDLRDRIASAGLIVVPESLTLGDIWDRFLDEPGDRKQSTLTGYDVSRKRFFSFFDKEGEPEEVTEADAADWKESLLERFKVPTVAGTISRTKAVFAWAEKRGLIAKNVFADLKRGSYKNKDREFFVPLPWYEKLLDACPDQTWRTIVALCRVGGLRCPSEVLGVRWEDVNWEHDRLLVRSPKTEHVSGHASRTIPLWSELRKELEAQFEQAEEGGSPFVIADHRGRSGNLRTYFEKIVFWAGLPQWERLFQNLRASRSNELFSEYPSHVASEWMGQSEIIARSHYLHATDQDYEKALSNTPQRCGCENSREVAKVVDH